MTGMRTSDIAPALDEQPVFQMLDWLTFKPTADDLARGLVTDYLRKYGAAKARFALLAEDDSLHHIGSYGFTDSYIGTAETSNQWRSRQDKVKDVVWNDNFIGWTPDRTMIGAAIRERGISKGSVVIEFDAPVEDHAALLDLATKLSRLIGFYLCNTYTSITGAKASSAQKREVSRGDFTSRQLQILQGMVEGKTNHELATDLGYSVSTVRHETMRIFQILGVSDRREAGRAALDRSIL
jgi:DNA-binding CsgD family transcriptional regulator